jgi:hypothetical protein
MNYTIKLNRLKIATGALNGIDGYNRGEKEREKVPR